MEIAVDDEYNNKLVYIRDYINDLIADKLCLDNKIKTLLEYIDHAELELTSLKDKVSKLVAENNELKAKLAIKEVVDKKKKGFFEFLHK
jgi:hypothetical protein